MNDNKRVYAYGKGKEIIVTQINYKNGTFIGEYKDKTGNKHTLTKVKIRDYDFYNNRK